MALSTPVHASKVTSVQMRIPLVFRSFMRYDPSSTLSSFAISFAILAAWEPHISKTVHILCPVTACHIVGRICAVILCTGGQQSVFSHCRNRLQSEPAGICDNGLSGSLGSSVAKHEWCLVARILSEQPWGFQRYHARCSCPPWTW